MTAKEASYASYERRRSEEMLRSQSLTMQARETNTRLTPLARLNTNAILNYTVASRIRNI